MDTHRTLATSKHTHRRRVDTRRTLVLARSSPMLDGKRSPSHNHSRTVKALARYLAFAEWHRLSTSGLIGAYSPAPEPCRPRVQGANLWFDPQSWSFRLPPHNTTHFPLDLVPEQLVGCHCPEEPRTRNEIYLGSEALCTRCPNGAISVYWRSRRVRVRDELNELVRFWFPTHFLSTEAGEYYS